MNIKKAWWFMGGASEFIIPSTFSASFSSKMFRRGTTYSSDYDFDAIPSSIVGTECWVDPTSGGTNAGTEANPFTNLATAVANVTYTVYHLKVGTRNIITSTGLTIGREIKFDTYGGDGFAEVASQITPSWSVNGSFGNVYEGSNALTSLSVNTIFDETNLDANGLPSGFTLVASIAAVSALANSFYYDAAADIVYVRTFDDRVPDSDVCVLVTSTTLRLFRFNGNLVAANIKVSMENIRVYGANPLVLSNTGTSFYWNFAFKNCHFSYAGNSNGVRMEGYGEGYFKDCRSDWNTADGFNYSNSVGFTFEWNCKAWFNQRASDANNGSSAHLGWKIIRVGGNYQYNSGKSVQDINSVKSYSLGCISRNSQAINQAHKAGYASDSTASGATEMWLIECIGPTDADKYWNFNTSTMYIFDGVLGNLTQGTNDEDPGSVTTLLTANQVYA